MSNAQQPAPPSPGEPTSDSPFLRVLLNNRHYLRGFFFALALLFLGFVLVRLLQAGRVGFNVVWAWAIVMGLAALAVGVFDLVKREDEAGKVRLELMVLGGALGLATALLG